MKKKLNPPPPEGGGFDARLKSAKGRVCDAGDLLADLEIIVFFGGQVLVLDVLCENFIRDIPARRNEVATCPQVPSPKGLVQASKFPHQSIRRLAFDRLHHSTRRKIRRHAQHQVHMVWPDVTLDDLDLHRPTDLPNQVARTQPDVSSQDRLAVLRDENEMVVDLVDRGIPFGTCRIVPQAS